MSIEESITHRLRESRNMKRKLEESYRPGDTFKNAGYSWKVIASKGDYKLVYSSEKKLEPYVVVWRLENDGSWGQGHYFRDITSATKFLKTKPGILQEENEVEDEEDIEESEDIDDEEELNESEFEVDGHHYFAPMGKYMKDGNPISKQEYEEAEARWKKAESPKDNPPSNNRPFLKEGKSIERRILEKLNESRRIDEAWPPILNNLNKYDKDSIRKTMQKLGIDIENTPYQTAVITNGRDPRLKGNNVCIFEFSKAHGTDIGVWCNNKFLVDAYDSRTNKFLRQMSWKDILASATRIISIEFDSATSQAMKDKQAGRREAQSGMVKRYKVGSNDKPRYAKLDKSGYIIDPDKYKNMFAALSVTNGDKLLVQAKEVYMKLAQKLDQIDFETDRDFYNYDYIMRAIPQNFASLTKELKSYEVYKAKYKNMGSNEDRWDMNYAKSQVTSLIKDLRELLAKAKKYL